MQSARRYDRKEKKIIKVPQPACIQLYNAHMGYIDVMDPAVSTYRIRMQEKNGGGPYFLISYQLW